MDSPFSYYPFPFPLSPLPFSLSSSPDPIKGTQLSISLPDDDVLNSFFIVFSTSPSSSALQWLSPPQTVSTRVPFSHVKTLPRRESLNPRLFPLLFFIFEFWVLCYIVFLSICLVDLLFSTGCYCDICLASFDGIAKELILSGFYAIYRS
ncbi:hypothetical protein ES332_D01G181500v1 [Gossypium tomentosum]|uniref:Uncharacterized protein n=1 Tax=Gossypium tomentosum TaxID=34277 RepID=A0A5D2MAU4_GOSTO|nr:hypothetical protein ES332_D01G181500v1 [Gossypium tomentosum]